MNTKDIDEFLMSDELKRNNMKSYEIVQLIQDAGLEEKYLNLESIRRFNLNKGDVIDLLDSVKDIDKVLTPELVVFCEMDSNRISKLVKRSKNIENYKIGKKVLTQYSKFSIANIIKATGRIEEYLESEIFLEYLEPKEVIQLIIETNNVKKYLTPEYIKKFGFIEGYCDDLIATLTEEEIEKYNLRHQKGSHHLFNIVNVIKEKGNIQEYLTIENIIRYNLSSEMITDLIKEASLEEKFRKDAKNNDSESTQYSIDDIIKQTGKVREYEKSKKSRIILPCNMKIGIEIEMIGEASCYILENYQDLGEDGFESKIDLSVYEGNEEGDFEIITADGVETVSPILTEDFEEASNIIKRVCGKLNSMRSRNK